VDLIKDQAEIPPSKSLFYFLPFTQLDYDTH